MKPVESSTISHIDFADGILSVKFKSNPKVVYDYPNVTAAAVGPHGLNKPTIAESQNGRAEDGSTDRPQRSSVSLDDGL
jgi:hypothetical protein